MLGRVNINRIPSGTVWAAFGEFKFVGVCVMVEVEVEVGGEAGVEVNVGSVDGAPSLLKGLVHASLR